MEKHIIGYELIGFGIAILFIWADEVFDLPHYLLGAHATPINWQESLEESIVLLALGLIVIYNSLRSLKNIKYLEGFLPVCAFCKKIKVVGKWIPIEEYVTDHSAVTFSHSYCPECTTIHYGDILKKT
ncbi:MAG: hypothetical protein V1753_09265 [Pseudomonadota bacterium]